MITSKPSAGKTIVSSVEVGTVAVVVSAVLSCVVVMVVVVIVAEVVVFSVGTDVEEGTLVGWDKLQPVCVESTAASIKIEIKYFFFISNISFFYLSIGRKEK